MGRIAGALDAQDAPGALYALLSRLGLPVGLREIGMPESGLEKVARIVSDAPYPNPEPVAYDGMLALMQRAYRGEPPQS
jgi:maleylacetate reductase